MTVDSDDVFRKLKIKFSADVEENTNKLYF